MHSLDKLQIIVILLEKSAFHTKVHTVAHADGSVLCRTFLNLRQIRKLNLILYLLEDSI